MRTAEYVTRTLGGVRGALRQLLAEPSTRSEYLNNDLDTTFYEYVNGFRIKEACALLSSDERRTLMEIAELSGFNSLSTFNRAFVKSIGETPARYLKKRQIKC